MSGRSAPVKFDLSRRRSPLPEDGRRAVQTDGQTADRTRQRPPPACPPACRLPARLRTVERGTASARLDLVNHRMNRRPFPPRPSRRECPLNSPAGGHSQAGPTTSARTSSLHGVSLHLDLWSPETVFGRSHRQRPFGAVRRSRPGRSAGSPHAITPEHPRARIVHLRNRPRWRHLAPRAGPSGSAPTAAR